MLICFPLDIHSQQYNTPKLTLLPAAQQHRQPSPLSFLVFSFVFSDTIEGSPFPLQLDMITTAIPRRPPLVSLSYLHHAYPPFHPCLAQHEFLHKSLELRHDGNVVHIL